MKKKVLLFGTTMFSAELAVIMRMEEVDVVGYVVDAAYHISNMYQGLPVYAFENIESIVDINTVEFVLSLGYSKMNDHRESKYHVCKSKGYKVCTFVSKKAQVFTEKIGEGCIILPSSYIGPCSEVGICTVVRPGTVLAHHDIVGCFNWIADGITIGGGVKIGKHCFLGLGTTIRNEVTIADYTFTGAQTYVGRDTDEHRPYLGVPAKEIIGRTSYEVVNKV